MRNKYYGQAGKPAPVQNPVCFGDEVLGKERGMGLLKAKRWRILSYQKKAESLSMTDGLQLLRFAGVESLG